MKLFILLLMLTNFYLLGCNNQEKQDEPVKNQETTQSDIPGDKVEAEKEIVFKVNGKPYYKEDLRHMNARAAVQDAILYEAALLEGKDTDPVYLKQIERYKKNILLGRFKGDIIKSYLANNKITEDDVKKYYDENLGRYSSLDLTKISTQDKETSEKIYKELTNGKSPDGIKTDYENISISTLDAVNMYQDRFNKLEPSEFTDPILENKFYNIYIIKNVYTKEYDAVKRIVNHQLINQYKQDALKQYADNIKKEKNIKIEMVSK